jgi:hypothetical protein
MRLKLFDITRAWDPVEAVTPEIEARRIFATSFGVLYQGDCLELLPYIRSEVIDTVFADPPFDLSREYDVVLDPFGGRGTTCVHMNRNLSHKANDAKREQQRERIRMSKVVIVMEGGLVQSVYSDDKQVQVAVLDHDVFEDLYPKLELDAFFFSEFDPELAVLKEWEKKKSKFQAMYPQLGEG